MTVLAPPASQQPWRRIVGIFAMYLIAAVIIALCLCSADDSGVRARSTSSNGRLVPLRVRFT